MAKSRKGAEGTKGRLAASQMRVNRRRWDEVVEIHAKAPFYDIEGFKRGGLSLHGIELDELGPVEGKKLLHLQCHFGLDTLSWARLGAQVTGVDYSAPGIAMARGLAKELDIPARFVRSDLYALPKVLEGRFDIVFTSYGVLSWLPDLDRWAKTVARYLKPGGTFYMVEGHPAADQYDSEPRVRGLRIVRPYFPGTKPIRFVTPGDYTDFDAKVRNRVSYEWGHPLGEILTALAHAGLRIEFVHEFPYCAWRMFPFMKRGKDGWWRLPAGMPSMPLMFSVRAAAPLKRGSR